MQMAKLLISDESWIENEKNKIKHANNLKSFFASMTDSGNFFHQNAAKPKIE
jgi:hypothetical protein